MLKHTCNVLPDAQCIANQFDRLREGSGGRGVVPPCRYLCVYVYKSYLKNFYTAQANSMASKTCFVASGKLLAEVAGECRCDAQGRASKHRSKQSVSLALTRALA